MIITCEACSTQFVLDDALIKPEGSKVKCSKCRHIFTAFPPDHPKIEVPDGPKPEEHDILFDEQAFQDDSNFNKSQNDDFSIDSDSDSQDSDLEDEDTDIDFSEIEFDEPEFQQKPPESQTATEGLDSQDQDIEIEDPAKDFDEDGLDFETADFDIDEPELDFQDNDLKLDTQEFEFEEIENGTVSGLTPVSADSDTDTADIEISFAQDDDADLELEELSLDLDDLSVEESSIDDLELDTKKDESPELDFDDDAQTDLILEDDDLDLSLESEEARIDAPAQQQGDIVEGQPDIKHDGLPSNDVKLESDDSEEPSEERDDREADEEIEQTASEQDKFAEYDTVLEQETEPEDAGITIPDPEVKDNTDTPETPLTPTDDKIDTTIEASIDQAPLITPPSAQSVRRKRSTKQKKGGSLAIKILLVLFLLILAAYVAIIRLGVTIPVVSDIQIPFITQWLEPKQIPPQPPLKPVMDEPSIDGRFVSNKSAGDLFIVTGRIKNPSNTAVSYIQVKGTLMTKNNTKAETLIAYCGNVIPEETLKSGNISDITKQMGVKQGHQNTNVNIKPGASVMFMLVFSNLPEDLSNFTVAVEGFEPAQE